MFFNLAVIGHIVTEFAILSSTSTKGNKYMKPKKWILKTLVLVLCFFFLITTLSAQVLVNTYFHRWGATKAVGVAGDYLIAATTGLGYVALDISNPANPVEIDTCAANIVDMRFLTFDDHLLAINESGGSEKLHITGHGRIRRSNSEISMTSMSRFHRNGNYIVVEYSISGGYQWDITNWTWASVYQWNDNRFEHIYMTQEYASGMETEYITLWGCAYRPPYLYLGLLEDLEGNRWIAVYQITDEGADSLGQFVEQDGRSLAADGDYLFVNSSSNTKVYRFGDDPLNPDLETISPVYRDLHALDYGSRLLQMQLGRIQLCNDERPENLSEISTFEESSYSGMSLYQNNLFIARGHHGILEVNLSDQERWREIWSREWDGSIGPVLTSGNYVYVGDTAIEGLHLLDATFPLSPVFTGNIVSLTSLSHRRFYHDLMIGLLPGTHCISIEDISNPFHPEVLSQHNLPENTYVQKIQILGDNHLALDVNADERYTRLLDITDPTDPVLLRDVPTDEFWIISEWVGARVSRDTLHLIDMRTSPPTVLLDTTGFGYEIAFSWPYLARYTRYNPIPEEEDYYVYDIYGYRCSLEGVLEPLCDGNPISIESNPSDIDLNFYKNVLLVSYEGSTRMIEFPEPDNRNHVFDNGGGFVFKPPALYVAHGTHLALLDIHNALDVKDNRDRPNTLPTTITLFPAYPNPFNAGTIIRYELPKAMWAKVAIYDILGREITTLYNGMVQPGQRKVYWDGRSACGAPVTSGIYILRLDTSEQETARRLTLIK